MAGNARFPWKFDERRRYFAGFTRVSQALFPSRVYCHGWRIPAVRFGPLDAPARRARSSRRGDTGQLSPDRQAWFDDAVKRAITGPTFNGWGER
jgi:hypothetical protein